MTRVYASRMNRTLVAGALGVALALALGCKKKESTASKGQETPAPATAPVDARGPTPATQPDPDFEKNRAELLRRGDPEMMKPAKVVDGSGPAATAADMIKVVSKDVMKVGAITVDLKAGRAELPAMVAFPTGPLEYVMVGVKGKAYESVFTVEAKAVELRLALTLLGFEGTVPAADGTLPAATAADSILVAVKVDGKERPLADYLVDNRSGKRAPDAPWQVVGFRDADRALALSTENFMTLVPRDVHAPLRITIDAGNPYAGPDQGLGLNKRTMPATGSKVTLVLRRRPDAPAAPPRTSAGN